MSAAYQPDKLAPLETFDPRAFVGDHEVPKNVCDFVLALAVVFNDLRDLIVAERLIRQFRPSSNEISPARGENIGLYAHCLRMLTGLLSELARLIQENSAAIDHPFFRRLVKQLGKRYREAWDNTVAAARATDPKGNRFGRMVYFARNKVAFHYDAKEISRAYKIMFFERDAGPPYVSHGTTLWQARGSILRTPPPSSI